jgi:hypothetical protein
MRAWPRSPDSHLVLLIVGALAFGCGGDDETTGPTPQSGPIIGTWTATSFTIDGFDAIGAGATITFIFSSDGTYTVAVTGDQAGFFCEGTTDCIEGGVFTATTTMVVLDPGTVDEVTVAISINADVLTVTGTIEGFDVVGTFLRV